MENSLAEKIDKFAALRADYDGMGAAPANSESLHYAKQFAAAFPDIGLTPTLHANGNVVLFRRSPWAELEFEPTGEIGFHAESVSV